MTKQHGTKDGIFLRDTLRIRGHQKQAKQKKNRLEIVNIVTVIVVCL